MSRNHSIPDSDLAVDVGHGAEFPEEWICTILAIDINEAVRETYNKNHAARV